MMRSVLAVVTGFVLWSALWLAGTAALAALSPEAFRADVPVEQVAPLVGLLILAAAISLVAGYASAAVARPPRGRVLLALGGLLLAVGLVVQVGYGALLPAWYHVAFLGLLVPAVLLGGRLRSGGGRRRVTS